MKRFNIYRIFHICDYIFYRIYKFVLAHPKMIVSDGAPYIFSFIILLMPLLLIIVPIFRMYGIHIRRYSLAWTIFMAILVAAQFPIWKRYQNPKNIEKYERCWNNESPRQKVQRGMGVDLLIINNVVIIPVILYLLIHYKIF